MTSPVRYVYVLLVSQKKSSAADLNKSTENKEVEIFANDDETQVLGLKLKHRSDISFARQGTDPQPNNLKTQLSWEEMNKSTENKEGENLASNEKTHVLGLKLERRSDTLVARQGTIPQLKNLKTQRIYLSGSEHKLRNQWG